MLEQWRETLNHVKHDAAVHDLEHLAEEKREEGDSCKRGKTIVPASFDEHHLRELAEVLFRNKESQ